MTHAEQYSTSEPGMPPLMGRGGSRGGRTRVRVLATLALVTGLAALAAAPSSPASAETLSSARAQAQLLAAKLGAEQTRIADLTNQYDAASYQLSQVDARISVTQAQLTKDQAIVNEDDAQLRVQAVNDYMNQGSTSPLTQMFTGNAVKASVRSEYAAISTADVTNTVDSLHSAQSRLQAQQQTLQSQQRQAAVAANSLSSSRSQATVLAAQLTAQTASANAQVRQILVAEQAAALAAAQAAAQAKLAAVQAAAHAAAHAAAQRTLAASTFRAASTHQSNTYRPSSSYSTTSTYTPPSVSSAVATHSPPTTSNSVTSTTTTSPAPSGGEGTGNGGGSGGGSAASTSLSSVPSGAAGAVQAAEGEIGVPYLWGGTTPAGFDCSGLVMWAYAQAGISLPHYSGAQYNDTTHIPLADIQPGDLLFYGPGGSQHVAMYIGGGMMVEAPYTGATVRNTPIRTGAGFVGVGRVN